MNRYDLIVLGSGSAARDAAAKAVQQCDASVALVESTRWGGSCPNVACKPTKAYLVVAGALPRREPPRRQARNRRRLPPASTSHGLKARKDTLKKGDAKWMRGPPGRRVRHPPGRRRSCSGRSSVRVGDEELSAERDPDRDRLAHRGAADRRASTDIDWIDHVSALELTELPESLLVVGGGPGRARVRADLRALRLARDDRPGAPTASRRAPTSRPPRMLHAALEEDDGIEIVLRRPCRVVRARRRRGRGRRSARAEIRGRQASCWRRAGAERRGARGWTSSESSTIAAGIVVDEPHAHARRRDLGRRRRRPAATSSRRSRSTRRGSRSTTCSGATDATCRLLRAADRDLHRARARRRSG